MTIEVCLDAGRLILAEGSVYELLRRDSSIEYDPFLAHGALVYDARAASVLRQIHRRTDRMQGGCCGTDPSHITCLADQMSRSNIHKTPTNP